MLHVDLAINDGISVEICFNIFELKQWYSMNDQNLFNFRFGDYLFSNMLNGLKKGSFLQIALHKEKLIKAFFCNYNFALDMVN